MLRLLLAPTLHVRSSRFACKKFTSKNSYIFKITFLNGSVFTVLALTTNARKTHAVTEMTTDTPDFQHRSS